MMIPDDKISEIKNSADILEIISESVILKKAGRNHIGLCPFHSEKTPSFSVNPERQIYKCFGCGEGGNVFTFLMKKDGLSFPEAVRHLGKRYGIEIPEKSLSPEQKKRIQEREAIFTVNQQALNFFKAQLKEGPAATTGQKYLSKRGISEDTINTFELGYVTDGWDHLIQYLGKRGVPLPLMAKSGLVVQKDTNRYYDRFRNRIIFPIFDIGRQVIGFGGRILKDAPKQPKYLNSPETFVYHKKQSLYGLHMARNAAREDGSVFIVEGYFDFLALWQHGVRNAVATLGTALSTEHAKIIKGFARTIYLVFDSDQAGIKAAERGLDIFNTEGIDTKIIILPTGYDPDSFVFEKGAEAFLAHKKSALSGISFLMHMAVKNYGLSVEGKLRIVNDMLPHLSKLSDTVQRTLYVKELSEQLNIDESAIQNKISEFTHNQPNHAHALPGPIPVKRPSNANVNTYKAVYNDQYKMEKQLVSMLLQFPEILAYFIEKQTIRYFESGELKKVCGLILEYENQGNEIASYIITKTEDEDLRKLIADLTISEEQWIYDGCKKFIDQFVFAKIRKNSDLDQEIKLAEESNDFQRLKELLTKKTQQVALLNKEHLRKKIFK